MSLPAIVYLRNYRHYEPARGTGRIGLNWLEMTAPPGKVFVAVIMGTEKQDGSDPLPLLAMLRDLIVDGEHVVLPPVEARP